MVMMHLIMQPGMVYRYPIWTVALLMIGLSSLGTVLLELTVRRFVSARSRREHNDATAAVFSVVGVTFAVLLAFVASVAWENFNRAKAASYTEAALALDVDDALIGFEGPRASAMHADLVGYLETVIGVEWPAQAEGQVIDRASVDLDALNREALRLRPSGPAEVNLHALLLQSLVRLRDARQDRMLAAQTTVPSIVWVVTVIGGALTIAFSSFLGIARLGLHLAMSCTLAISGVLVLVMILALSNPFRGDFRVSMQPFERVLERVQLVRPAP
jgi:hypothetical protein